MRNKVLLLYSGGVDSLTLLHHYMNKKYDITAISFIYGSTHQLESEFSDYVCKQYNIPRYVFDISNITKNFRSTLLGTDAVDKNNDNRPDEYVPNRNMIFISIATGLAESLNIDTIGIGVHKSDAIAEFPDCRVDFVDSINKTIKVATNKDIMVDAPFIHATKDEIIEYAIKLNVPFELAYSCYRGQMPECGECLACKSKFESYKKFGLDPEKIRSEQYKIYTEKIKTR